MARTSASSIRRPATTSRSTTPATARGRRLPVAVQAEVPQPELVPVRGADRHVGRTIRTSTSSRRTTSTARRTRTASVKSSKQIADDLAGRADNVGPKTIPNYDAVVGRRDRSRRGRRQDVRRPGRRPVLRRPRRTSSTASTSTSRAGQHRPRQPGRRQGRRRGLQHALVRAAGARVAGDARRQVRPGARQLQRRRRRVGDDRAQAAPGRASTAASATSRQVWRPGQPPRQPADQRGRHPARREGQVQPHVARGRRGELRQVRPQPRAGPAAERPVRPRRQGDEPDRHRPGAADRRARTDADRQEPGAGRHAEAQPRRAARGDREPLRRARRRPGRLPERPPAGRRRRRHRAARHRRRAAARRPGRQADPARRRRGPERQAVPVDVPVRRRPDRRVHRHRRSGRSRRTRRSRSRDRRSDPRCEPAASSPSSSRSPRRSPSFAATRGDERAAAGPPRAGALDVRPQGDTRRAHRPAAGRVRSGRSDRQAALAAAYLQKVRETGDPSFYARAEPPAPRALARTPSDRARSCRPRRWPPRGTTSAPR